VRRIASRWRLDGDRFEFTVTVPPGTAATVTLPDGTSFEAGPGCHRAVGSPGRYRTAAKTGLE
jgi:hypothetical protein